MFKESIVIFPPLYMEIYSVHYVQWFLLNRTDEKKERKKENKLMAKKTCDGVLQATFAFGLAIVLLFLLGVRLNYISTTKIYNNFYGGRKKNWLVSFTHRLELCAWYAKRR